MKRRQNSVELSHGYRSVFQKDKIVMKQGVISRAVSKQSVQSLETDTNSLVNDSKNYVNAMLKHPDADRPLTGRDQAFVNAYLKCKVVRRAALEAGYSESVANTQAHKWLKVDIEKNTKLHVFKAIHLRQQQAESKAIRDAASKVSSKIIDADYVKQKTVEQIEKNNGEIPTHISKIIDAHGNEQLKEHYKYNPQAVLKALELLGKHKEIKAFDNTQELGANESLVNLLSNLNSTTRPGHLIQGESRRVPDIVEGELVTESQQAQKDQAQETRSLLPSGQVPPPPPKTD